ncbi:MAG: hypothetical protein ABI999_13360 [Acidobacteriota bacterium]
MRLLASILVIVFLSLVPRASGQEQLTCLKDTKVSLKVDHQPLATVLRKLMFEYDISVGFEESILDRDHDDYSFETNGRFRPQSYTSSGLMFKTDIHPVVNVKNNFISIDVKDAKLDAVLDTIVSQMRNYAWRVDSGVVDIYPTASRDPNFERLLNLKIEQFRFANGMHVAVIRTKLFELPEVSSYLSENKIRYRDFTNGMTDYKSLQQVRMDFENLTLLELLNNIARTNHGGWILKSNKFAEAQGTKYIELQL